MAHYLAMRLGIDLCSFDPDFTGGVNTFGLGLAHGLLATREPGESIVFLVNPRNALALQKTFAGNGARFITIAESRWDAWMNSLLFKVSWATGEFRLRYWYDRVLRAGRMRRIDGGVDAMVSPMTLLKWYGMRTPTLLSIHDIQHEYHPELFSWINQLRRWAPYRLSAWRADGIQASSHYIRDCLVEKFPFVKPEKIFVIPEGVDLEQFSSTGEDEAPPGLQKLRGQFIFYPAQLWAHKNHGMLVEALGRYRDRHGVEMPCVMTGKDYGVWQSCAARIATLGLTQIHYLGRVSFEQLLWLYRNCRAVLALGLHESSSLPLREGAVFGKTLICLDIPPNREDAKKFHVTLVDRHDPASLAGTLTELVAGRIGADAGENVQISRNFDWKTLASEYRRTLKMMVQA